MASTITFEDVKSVYDTILSSWKYHMDEMINARVNWNKSDFLFHRGCVLGVEEIVRNNEFLRDVVWKTMSDIISNNKDRHLINYESWMD